MAELELTKIEDRMPNGGGAIGKNFDAVKGAVDPMLQDTGWLPLTMANGATGSSNNKPQYRRIGTTVYLTGQATTGGATGPIGTLPAGFRPAFEVHRDPSVASSTRTETVRVFISTAGVISVVSLYHDFGIWLDGFRFESNDDFPN